MSSSTIVGLITCVVLIVLCVSLCYFSYKDMQKQVRERDLFRSKVVSNLEDINKKVGGK